MTAINRAPSKAKTGEVTKVTTQVLDRDREMMDITVKIISGIVLEGQVGEEVDVKIEDLGPIIIIIMVDNPQTKIPNVGEEEIKIGEGDMDIVHSIVNPQHMSKIAIHPRGNILT